MVRRFETLSARVAMLAFGSVLAFEAGTGGVQPLLAVSNGDTGTALCAMCLLSMAGAALLAGARSEDQAAGLQRSPRTHAHPGMADAVRISLMPGARAGAYGRGHRKAPYSEGLDATLDLVLHDGFRGETIALWAMSMSVREAADKRSSHV